MSSPLQQQGLKAHQMVNMLGKSLTLDCKLGLWASGPLQQQGLKAQQMDHMLGTRVMLKCKLGF